MKKRNIDMKKNIKMKSIISVAALLLPFYANAAEQCAKPFLHKVLKADGKSTGVYFFGTNHVVSFGELPAPIQAEINRLKDTAGSKVYVEEDATAAPVNLLGEIVAQGLAPKTESDKGWTKNLSDEVKAFLAKIDDRFQLSGDIIPALDEIEPAYVLVYLENFDPSIAGASSGGHTEAMDDQIQKMFSQFEALESNTTRTSVVAPVLLDLKNKKDSSAALLKQLGVAPNYAKDINKLFKKAKQAQGGPADSSGDNAE